jgi:hypothetical protein
MRCYLDWRDDKPRELNPGIYCTSATILQGLYLEPGGTWTVDHERQDQEAKKAVEELAESSEAADQENKVATYDQFNRLRLAKLLSYLRTREPDDQVGYSILIYRVSDNELSRALD